MPSLHSEHVLSQLDAQREWGFLCDVLVSIGDTQFRAHRAVLAACSAFFRMLFIQSDCRGQQSVDLSHTGLSAAAFDQVLQYMYQGRSTLSLDFEELKASMLKLQMYHVPETPEELGQVQDPESGTKLVFGVRMFPSRPGPVTRPETRPEIRTETRLGLETRGGPETSSSTGNSRPLSVEDLPVLDAPVVVPPQLVEVESCEVRRGTGRKGAERLKERPRFGRTFTCDDCGFVFSCEKLLIEHILTCTNRKNPPRDQTRDQGRDQTRDQARDHTRDHARARARDPAPLYHTDADSSPDSADARVKAEAEDWTRTESGPVTVKSEPDLDSEPGSSHQIETRSETRLETRPDQDSAKRIKLEPGLDSGLDPGLDSGLDQDSDSRCELCGLELKGRDLSAHYLSAHVSHMCACGRCGQVLIKGRQLQEHAQRCAQNPDRDQDRDPGRDLSPDLTPDLSRDLSPDLNPDLNQTQEIPENPEEESEEEDHEEEEMEACHLLDTCESVAGASLAGLVPAALSLEEPRRRHFCGLCGRGFFQRCHLREHYTVHTKHKQFTCLTCGKGFLRQRQLRLHQDMHRGVARYVCPVCEQGTFLKQDHVRHMISHLSPGETICQVCFQMFPGTEQLEQHMDVHLYVCSVCGDKFRLRKDMRSHCTNVHNKRV